MNKTPYEVTKITERKWGVVLRLGERESISTRVYRKTRREAQADARMLNAEHARLNDHN